MTRPALRPYQATGVQFLEATPRALLADEPGLGKSRQMIEASRGRTLVVAPAMVLTGGTWADEINRWADDPGRFTTAAFTSLNQRAKTAKGGQTVLPLVKPEFKGPWDTLIIDEAHYIKGRKTTWTDAVKTIADNSDRVFLATGTPISNWAHELFTLLQVLEPEQAKPGKDLGSYWRWVDRWFRTTPSPFNPRARDIGDLLLCDSECLQRPSWDPCEHYQQFVDVNLAGRFMRRERDQVLDLPPVTEQDVQTPLSPAARKVYTKLKAEYLAEIGDGTSKVAWNTGERNVMLDLMTVSPWLLNPTGKPRGGKLDMLAQDLRDRSRPTLVLAHYRQVVQACAQVAESVVNPSRVGMVHGGVSKGKAAKAVQDFKDGKLDVLVGSLETVAEGLTLVAADMAIFVERSYKPYRNVQAMRRIHRLGQERPVTIRRYLTPKTVDTRKERLLNTKTDRQMRVLSARDFADLL